MGFAMGLVGCGVMGRRHVIGMKNLKAAGKLNFELAAVCDVMPENLQRMGSHVEELFGTPPQLFADFETMAAQAKLDGIIITTSPEMHLSVAEKAFEAGLHVMVEKPITLTVAEGVRMVEAAKQAKRKLAVAENYRRDPINRLGKALVDGGALGTPFLATQESSGGGEFVIITPWRHRKDRGGIVIDMGVHYTDILEFYMGPIETVVGMNAIVDKQRVDAQGALHPVDAEDLSVGVMRFRSGAIANWLLNVAGRGEGHFSRMIYGTGGSLAIPGDRTGKALNLVQRVNGKDVPVPVEELFALVPEFALDATTAALFKSERLLTYDLPWADIDANLLGIEQADFVDAIMHDREPEVTGEQGLRSLALVFGLLESELLRRMVTLDEVLQGKEVPYQAEIKRSIHV
ncbi:MAG: Gfo/Idh/MocA family oxidoreductase [Anaerolineae bacterium]|nr:Gfo/Idh/MocA family oxidoreductase [Anaerolineae bacterium]